MKTNKIIPYAVVINFSRTRIFGKIGPFDDWKEVHEWAVSFRNRAREGNVDMTAISGEVLMQMSAELPQQEFLSSKEPEEIISHACATALFGISV